MDYTGMGRRIRNTRLRKKMTQAELAEKCDLSTSFVGHIERGSRKASIESIANIALCLGTSLDFLLFGESVETMKIAERIKPGLMPEQKELAHRIVSMLYEHAENWTIPKS